MPRPQAAAQHRCVSLFQLASLCETNSPLAASELTSLRELDVRAAKKQVCKIAPEVAEALGGQLCKVRGGVIKKAKGGKKKTAAPA